MPKFQIDENELCRIISDAPQHILRIARKDENPAQKSFDDLKNQWKHRRLSQAWIKYLSYSLEEHYKKENDQIYAFPSQFDLKRKLGIKQSEFLFDVSVGLYRWFKSKKFEGSKKVIPIHYQAHSIWQIESEFAENTREITIDFSKLLAGNAEYALMVAPSGKKETDYYMKEMKNMLQWNDTLSGKIIYFLILPHPSDWVDEKGIWNNGGKWYLYKWKKNKWEKVPEGKGYWKLNR